MFATKFQVIGELKSYQLTGKVLARFELDARQLSAFASTSIEGNPLALTDVKRVLKSAKEHVGDTEREVLNYNHSLQVLYSSVRKDTFKLNIATLEKTQKRVVDGLMDNPADCGRMRQAPVVIRTPRKIDEIIFIPPDAKDVKKSKNQYLD